MWVVFVVVVFRVVVVFVVFLGGGGGGGGGGWQYPLLAPVGSRFSKIMMCVCEREFYS